MSKSLSLEEKFGQMILLGLDVYDINDEIINIIKDYKIGGVVLYKKNYTSIDTMIKMINKLKKINEDNKIPLFIAIDQENGRVNRLPKDITRIHSAKKQAECEEEGLVKTVNKITASLLSLCGVNMNFAPVADIVRSEKNKVIGDRSYGSNKEIVIKYGVSFMEELQKRNIVSVVKHFPGHGLSNKDSHFIIPKINDVDSLKKEDIKVFESFIANGADAIMIGHLRVKGYGLAPASLNKNIINGLLINSLKYKGLIVTDDIRMHSLRLLYSPKKAIKKAIEAGNNLIMIKYKKNDSKKLYGKLLKDVRNCEIDPLLIDNSAKKILQLKKKYDVNSNIIENKIDIEKYNNAIKRINSFME